jgi:hypothetical protein
MRNRIITAVLTLFSSIVCAAQVDSSTAATQTVKPLKISHAEPLYIDLIRDLGARKGEREWNVGWGINDERESISHTGFIEYEFSPVNRLGLEVEVPFIFSSREKYSSTPANKGIKVEEVKLAAQYTFLVSAKYNLSLAAGNIYELEFATPYATMPIHVFSPFLVAAKRWGTHIHTLLYTGPVVEHSIVNSYTKNGYQINASMHYVMPETRSFIGVEVNREYYGNLVETTLRPQIKLTVSKSLALGFVTGIPLHFEQKNLSFLTRLVYEPQRKAKR